MDNKPKTRPVESRFQRILRQSAEYAHQFADYLDRLSKSGKTPESDKEVIEDAKRIAQADERGTTAKRCFIYRLLKRNWQGDPEKMEPLEILSGIGGKYIKYSKGQVAEGFRQYRDHIHDRYDEVTLLRVYETVLAKVATPGSDETNPSSKDIANGMLEVSAVIDEAEKSKKIRFIMWAAIGIGALVAISPTFLNIAYDIYKDSQYDPPYERSITYYITNPPPSGVSEECPDGIHQAVSGDRNRPR